MRSCETDFKAEQFHFAFLRLSSDLDRRRDAQKSSPFSTLMTMARLVRVVRDYCTESRDTKYMFIEVVPHTRTMQRDARQ